jgi:hypothetical protein
LPADHFATLREEFLHLTTQTHETWKSSIRGNNIRKIAGVAHFAESVMPAIYSFFADARLNAILRAAEKRPLYDLWKYGQMEILTQGPSGQLADPESELHSDVWFTTHKVWLYVDDVGMEHGPLAYVKGSHRLSAVQLSYLYGESWKRDRNANPSRRISSSEADRVGAKESVVTCAKNTLVIVNTCGYHRRLAGHVGSKRHAVHLFLRANPFAAYSLQARLREYPRVYEMLRSARKALSGARV